jgi:hypothetical protein
MSCKTFKSLIIVCLLILQTPLNAQKEVGKLNNKVGITFSSLGVSNILGQSSSDDYRNTVKNFYTLGATYIRGLTKWLDVETGVEYSSHSVNTTMNILPNNEVYMRTPETKLNLFNVPATLRANFLKYFFVNGGVIIDIDVSNSIYFENQTGIGGIAGVGANYNFNSGLSLFFNPYIKAHSWIDVGTRQKILEKGFRIGITYDLHRIIKKK